MFRGLVALVVLAVAACAPETTPVAGTKGGARLADAREAAQRPTWSRATSTSTTSSIPAGTPARSSLPGSPPCGTSSPSRYSPPIPGPATASTRSRRSCWAISPGATCITPALSKTAGDYDGRWLFVNDNANNRIARIDLRDLKTKQILGPIPNSMGNHGSSFVTDEHRVRAGRDPVLGADAAGSTRRSRTTRPKYKGVGHRDQDRFRDRHDGASAGRS